MGSSLRQLALVGTAVAVTGGVAYVVWKHYFSAPVPPGPEECQQQPLLGAQERAALSCTGTPEGQDKPPSKQILVLGLDGAGKTSVLHSLATNHVKRSSAPTEGFNAVCVSTEETKMEFLEIGGSENLRDYWKMYLPRVLLLIYVVDSADHVRLPVAKKLLHQLVQSSPTLPVMILANKQDLEGAYCITDIHDALALSELGDERKMFLIGTHVAKDGFEISSSLKDTRELIAQLVSETL
ncbi:ADP-ribosylation factor-like protein 9 isoform X4 [Varanus komodoensis]|uniref:ADP-ribosylation factor-like protein 9 isoform X4 n=2 Tax=Varanus komodoensis TaxID=61221 RepID=UPI001CF7B429|nr:ADP-ribosylation factor-like protein 9 isoform X4 [Varanus komodoensis]